MLKSASQQQGECESTCIGMCVCGCIGDCEVWELGRARSDGTGVVCGWRRAPSMGAGSAEEARNVGSGLWKPVEPQPSKLETQKWGG